MLRCAAGRSLTRLSPISTSPLVIGSSPAMIRSKVDLPQPDGPTNTTNSWSAICRFKSAMTGKPPKLLTRLRISIEAMKLIQRQHRLDQFALGEPREILRQCRKSELAVDQHAVFVLVPAQQRQVRLKISNRKI